MLKMAHLKNVRRAYCAAPRNDEVIFEVTNNKIGLITLNRPKALNSLNEPMANSIYERLRNWESECSFVLVRGAGDKAFCAGGDVVAVTRGGPNDCNAGKAFFRSEYKMNHLISVYKRPYIALIDGITMGGGVGLSVHGPYRIATEKTLLAMPETAIGLFPDVGASYVLPRLKHNLGYFLGLCGYRLKGVDVAKAGFATHYVPSNEIPELVQKLMKIEEAGEIESVLRKNTLDISNMDFTLSPYLDLIELCFSPEKKSVEDIFAALREDGSHWAAKISDDMAKMSPVSLKLSKRALDLGSTKNLRNCLKMEFRLANAALEAKISTDFHEGVRALLVDKDKSPKWNPAALRDITPEMIEKCFEPIQDELDI